MTDTALDIAPFLRALFPRKGPPVAHEPTLAALADYLTEHGHPIGDMLAAWVHNPRDRVYGDPHSLESDAAAECESDGWRLLARRGWVAVSERGSTGAADRWPLIKVSLINPRYDSAKARYLNRNRVLHLIRLTGVPKLEPGDGFVTCSRLGMIAADDLWDADWIGTDGTEVYRGTRRIDGGRVNVWYRPGADVYVARPC